jgi:hypothetical protein
MKIFYVLIFQYPAVLTLTDKEVLYGQNFENQYGGRRRP